MATHAQNIENLRTATYGEQVRGSMIELFEEDYDLCKNGVWVGTDISSAADPTTGYPDGTLYINSDTWHLFKLEGLAWSDKGTIKGAQGESVVQAVDNGNGTFYLVLSNGSRTNNIATVQGIQGPTGPQGPTGLTGAAGRSVTSITMTGTGKQHPIVATYSDGVSQTVGVVQDGADGSGTGDMSKATYDVNDVGYVDKAAALTDGINIMPYSTVAGKADAATTLAGYGITDAYTATECDDRYMQLPSAAIDEGKIPISDGSSGFTWEDQPTVDQTYNPESANAQSGVAVEEGIDESVHEIVVTTDASVSAGSVVYVPAPTQSGGGYIYNYDGHINNNTIIVPVADPISNRGVKFSKVETTVATDGGGNVVGYVKITLADTIPANHRIGVLAINR